MPTSLLNLESSVDKFVLMREFDWEKGGNLPVKLKKNQQFRKNA
jgi:hypothetical protein